MSEQVPFLITQDLLDESWRAYKEGLREGGFADVEPDRPITVDEFKNRCVELGYSQPDADGVSEHERTEGA